MERMKVTISLGSSCRGNNGAGGWAAILSCNGKEKIKRGYDRKTTSNRMEIRGAISAIQALNRPCDITFRTDNDYFVETITKIKDYLHDRDPNEKINTLTCWKTASGRVSELAPLWCELTSAGLKGGHGFEVLRVDRKDRDAHRCNVIAKEQIELHILMEGDPIA